MKYLVAGHTVSRWRANGLARPPYQLSAVDDSNIFGAILRIRRPAFRSETEGSGHAVLNWGPTYLGVMSSELNPFSTTVPGKTVLSI